MGMKV